jgi:hypothetical protein
MIGLLSPSDPDHQASATFSDSTVSVTVPLTLDLLVGETLVRKLISSVSATLTTTTLTFSLQSITSHDTYLRPIPKESFANTPIPLLTLPFSLGSLFEPACYGLSDPLIALSSPHTFELGFSQAVDACPSKVQYSRAFFLELTRQLKLAEDKKRGEAPAHREEL